MISNNKKSKLEALLIVRYLLNLHTMPSFQMGAGIDVLVTQLQTCLGGS
jgi:hypothetical protein